MSKYTPGPWLVDYDCSVINDEGILIVNPPAWGFEDTVASEANAHLISAAPEMLEALKQIIRECNGDGHFPLMGIVLNAVAKAEGDASE